MPLWAWGLVLAIAGLAGMLMTAENGDDRYIWIWAACGFGFVGGIGLVAADIVLG